VRALAPCSCQGQALGPRLRGDNEQGGVPHANFRNEVIADPLAACPGVRSLIKLASKLYGRSILPTKRKSWHTYSLEGGIG
jgi:hypothetical protein